MESIRGGPLFSWLTCQKKAFLQGGSQPMMNGVFFVAARLSSINSTTYVFPRSRCHHFKKWWNSFWKMIFTPTKIMVKLGNQPIKNGGWPVDSWLYRLLLLWKELTEPPDTMDGCGVPWRPFCGAPPIKYTRRRKTKTCPRKKKIKRKWNYLPTLKFLGTC